MADFNKRIFGSNINQKIKNKLIARQALADNPNPNESVQFVEVNGKQVNISEAIGTHNFSKEKNDVGHLFELSSRTPWARAWIAVELYYYQPEVRGRLEVSAKEVMKTFLIQHNILETGEGPSRRGGGGRRRGETTRVKRP